MCRRGSGGLMKKSGLMKMSAAVLAVAAVSAAVVYYCCPQYIPASVVTAETCFRSVPRGLKRGSAVYFRGACVGRVKRVSLAGARYSNVSPLQAGYVHVEMGLNGDLPRLAKNSDSASEALGALVERGLQASCPDPLLSGSPAVELDFAEVDVVPERLSWRPEHVSIPSVVGRRSALPEKLEKLLSGLEEVDFGKLGTSAAGAADKAALLCEAVGNLVDTQAGNIARAIENINETVSALREFAEQVRDNPSTLVRPTQAEELPETK